jgi:predicted anti-sigma-YlaC factor YlaD
MDCTRIRDLLADYSVQILDGRTHRQVESHLQICAGCREELRVLDAVMSLVEEHGTLAPPPGLFNAVRNQIESGQVARQRPAWWAIFLTTPARVAAMGMAMGAVALGLMMPTTPVNQSLKLDPHLPAVGQVATGELSSSVRQHAMAATEGPLADRVAWEAMAQIASQQLYENTRTKPSKERRVE